MSRVLNAVRSVGSDGLSVGERSILDLWDDGWSIQRIAATGISHKYVKDTISLYDSVDEARDLQRSAVVGSQLLAAAVIAAGGHR
jgi:hypothetical protein